MLSTIFGSTWVMKIGHCHSHGVIRCIRDLLAMSTIDLGHTHWDGSGSSLAWAIKSFAGASRQAAFASTTQAVLAQMMTACCARLKQQCHTLSLAWLHHSSRQPCSTILAGSLIDALEQPSFIIIPSEALPLALVMSMDRIISRESVCVC